MFGGVFNRSGASLTGHTSAATSVDAYGLSDSGKVLAEYIWLGGSGLDLRSRTVVIDEKPYSVEDLPLAEIDGSACGQASADSCEVYLQPRRIFPDPCRGGDHILVLCDTFVPPQFNSLDPIASMRPHTSNARVTCESVMSRARRQEPQFSITQEYLVTDTATGASFGPNEPGASCSRSEWASVAASPALAGASARCGKQLQELHMLSCLRAGLAYRSSSSMAGPGVWSYKLGPGDGLAISDELWVSRHLLQRLCEDRGVAASFAPRPLPGDWGGSCCSVEYSTNESRSARSGMSAIERLVTRLQQAHDQHLPALGRRVAPSPASASHPFAPPPLPLPPFSAGVGNKRAAVMIPSSTLLNRCGPLLDRRPAPHMCPYTVTSLMVAATLDTPLPPGARLTLPPPLVPPAPAPPVSMPAPPRGISGWPPALHARLAAFAAATQHLPLAQAAAAAAAAAAASPAGAAGFSGGSFSLPSDSGSSLCTSPNSEQVLISELERMDAGAEGFAPDTPPNLGGSLALSDDACSGVSDGSSPARRTPLLGARASGCLAATIGGDMFYE